jgi:hypothetical protein
MVGRRVCTASIMRRVASQRIGSGDRLLLLDACPAAAGATGFVSRPALPYRAQGADRSCPQQPPATDTHDIQQRHRREAFQGLPRTYKKRAGDKVCA